MGGMENRLPIADFKDLAPVVRPSELDVVRLLRGESDPFEFVRRARSNGEKIVGKS